ncbi:conserved hypothetical protein [Burkholderiales bacterium 8X]|nr:conserved hypothetical protein [Burkholderiales bacterium 8X]
MNPQWNTPPNGDFASYVERLSAQSALPRREQDEGAHGLDIGMSPSGEPHGDLSDAAAALRRRLQSNGEAQPAAHTGRPGPQVLKAAAAIWVVAMVAMVFVGLPLILVLALFAVGVWLAAKFRHLLLPAGMDWKTYLENAARAQQMRVPKK